MSLTDPIADMLTRIRNGQRANLSVVKCPHSIMKDNILKVMLEEGYIQEYNSEHHTENIKYLTIKLKYTQGKPVIKKIDRVSKPGRRVYSQIKGLKKYYNGLGISILSTSRGIMSDYQAASMNVGGEIICNLY